jgi:hypothetical protein
VGAAGLVDPLAPLKAVAGLESYLRMAGITDIQNLAGGAPGIAQGASV